MATTLLSSLVDTSFTFKPISKKINKKDESKAPKFKHHHQHIIISSSASLTPYPKSSPTPLLPPSTLTRDQALDRVLADIESSLARGVGVDPSILSSLLETCCRTRSLRHGARLHRLIPHSLLRRSSGLSSKLLRLYSSCGQVEHAHRLFDQMASRTKTSPFVWNSLISGYANAGLFDDAMAMYYQMEEEGVEPDQFTFPRVLKACAGLGSVHHGEAVHRHAVRAGLACDMFVLNALIDMYAKCGDIMKAYKIFRKMPHRDAVSWNSMLIGYIRHGLLVDALGVCREMIEEGVEPDSVTVSSLLAGFSLSGKLGLEVHCWVIRRGLEWNLSVANSLIRMYSERNQLGLASMIFKLMPVKDLVSWNAVISAHRRDSCVLDVFRRMEESGQQPDRVTFVSLLSACANLGLVEDGRRLFDEMTEKYGITPGPEHYGCIVNLLGRAGLVDEAYELVLGNMPFEGGATAWGALLYACLLYGNVGIAESAAERLFELEPDNEHNFELMMRIYKNAGRLEDAEEVRRLMKERGLEVGTRVL